MVNGKLIALIFLFFVIIIVGTSVDIVKQKADKKQTNENWQTQNLNQISTKVEKIQESQTQTEGQLATIQTSIQSVLQKPDVPTTEQIIAIAQQQAQKEVQKMLNYQPVAYCLMSPSAIGGIDLSCRNLTG
jgi:hypothetical protein